jgi:hypothetical protein
VISTCIIYINKDEADAGMNARQRYQYNKQTPRQKYQSNRRTPRQRYQENKGEHHLGLSDTFIRSRAVIPVTPEQMDILYDDELKKELLKHEESKYK